MTIPALHINKTEETPEVVFRPELNVFSIVGRSLPENAFDFYSPILQWMKEFSAHIHAPVNIQLHLDYFNSSSGRFLYELLTMLEETGKAKNFVTVQWICDLDDELMIEKGEELAQLLDLRFEVIKK